MIPKFSVNRVVYCSLWKNKPSSHWLHIGGECSSVAFEENPVQNTLAALHVHSQSCTELTSKW